MAFSERSLDDYVDVAQRIADFREQYPHGSLQPADPAKPWEQAVVNGYDKQGKAFAATMIVYVAAAYRTPDDTRPGIGIAWEAFPGRTPYTLGSELMNAETSAWGRAIIAVLASDSKKGVASRQEVKARRAERDDGRPVNADGSLARARTTDEQKAAAGVMTSAQLAEHTALQAKRRDTDPSKVTRARTVHLMRGDLTLACGHAGTDSSSSAAAEVTCAVCRRSLIPVDNRPVDMWQDKPAGSLPDGLDPEDKPGSINRDQQKGIMAGFAALGVSDRAGRLQRITGILKLGTAVSSTNELSYREAGDVLAWLNRAQKMAGIDG
jgi:hypothetical protein